MTLVERLNRHAALAFSQESRQLLIEAAKEIERLQGIAANCPPRYDVSPDLQVALDEFYGKSTDKSPELRRVMPGEG